MINLTSMAIEEVKRLKSSFELENSNVRIEIKKGGCVEYIYQLNFNSSLQPEDYQFKINSAMTVIIDPQSYPYLKNLTIDYTEDLMGGAFQFKNPDIKNHCSCGLSFALGT
ncbi:MAG: iron-sulfur cluster assembly accessory protein [Cyanobacteria bacterium]|nr:iron-sulfur cluster assembly accessory protein [Cyanobacteria bacterium CG_2015-16_32_12]NCO78042.1 iron-sulfur cluster assembly accessory protein [Cyanobacteria bacterium CG_2015-22_32_23]NCQ05344.1 iron-sulfur cluster assembly accessory protein [Cyanobacteria bacterium CG_2015-09_32_10]NCS83711.1 iron-sulfur cluster assembly accessory protein [Cyanobacteria bacterium CG_2015-02_32_10]